MRVTWLLLEELAVGSAPFTVSDLDQLQGEGVRAVLSLCAVEEAALPEELAERFHWFRLPLPDHHHDRPPSVEDLGRVIVALRLLR
ncbi:MAG: phosphatase, partial [Cyanobacteria bacterium]|nr:phosphatase [Cyanobacteriota bacterium]